MPPALRFIIPFEKPCPLGYRQPFGAHLRYFVLDGQGRKLGCLLFDFAVRKVACRDEWIGWAGQKYRKHLKLVVRNARFLLFPWIGVKNLASHVLGLAARQVAADWQRQHRYRPVLLETYVDSERYAGTCYRAAGWQCVGKTQGRKAQGRNPAVTPKAVYVRPLHPRWQQALLQGPRALARKKSAARAPTPPPRAAERTAAQERFLQMWARVLADVVRVTSEWDRAWMQRQRLLNTLLVVLFVFRLVLAPRNQGYAATATELWDQCRQLDIPLPQSAPVSPAALSRARAKIHPQAFLRVHRAVLQHAPRDDPRALWRGHRVFAVDGSKLNLPRPLVHDGYRLPSETAHYPQGLLSCLYQLRTQLPVDFDLVSHNDERRAALAHLEALAPGEVAVYDRGYYSFRLLHTHCARGVQAVFRLKKNANGPFRAFIRSALSADEIVVEPSATARAQLPDTLLRPCRVRLVKYTAGASSYALATTLLDAKAYPARALADLYHGRWSIEELYKISKQMLAVEYFYSRSERGVKQELFASFHADRDDPFVHQSHRGRLPHRGGLAAPASQLSECDAHHGAQRGRAATAVLDHAVPDRREHARQHRALPPAPASLPLLSAEIAQARQQMEVLQQVRQDQASHTSSLTPHNPARNDGISA